MMEIDPSDEEAFPGITAMRVELQVMYKIKDGAYFNFATVHTLCTSRDTCVSCGWCLLIQGYFCAV